MRRRARVRVAEPDREVDGTERGYRRADEADDELDAAELARRPVDDRDPTDAAVRSRRIDEREAAARGRDLPARSAGDGDVEDPVDHEAHAVLVGPREDHPRLRHRRGAAHAELARRE